ncbi:MAG: circadian clock protein KaiC [Limisphaerales bacterium]
MKNAVSKLQTNIDGFDYISMGGLPAGRTTLVSGTAGSAKTVMAAQFLVEGITKSNQPGVFVTFEEPADAIRRNMRSFGWDIAKWEKQGMWAFVDAAPRPSDEAMVAGEYDLEGLLIQIHSAIKKVKAKRLSMDSLGAIFTQFEDSGLVRRELFRIVHSLNDSGVTSIITSERVDEYGSIARFGVEEFVADNVMILRNVLEEEKRRRTIEILKFRGTNHLKGEFPFTVLPDAGMVVIPLSALELKQKSSNKRISSGNTELDQMCGGGFFQDSIVLVSGATGTGKTLAATEFMAGGVKNGERCLFFAFEESRDQLFRNAEGWGYDFNRMEKSGKLKAVCIYPEAMSLEDHLLAIKDCIETFKPTRVAIDSFSALQRIATAKSFREFVVGLTSHLKHLEIAGLLTSTTPNLLGGASVTEAHISSITDSIILLRYVEIYGEMRRGLTVLKMRGSMHDKNIREFTIDSKGMHIGKPFRDVSGILIGRPHQRSSNEIDSLGGLFQE